ncbi:MAG: imidazoleglycerol-phosphate dehydratase, partial [Firmicutes bacterium]|nr:imidazoleglycerol-phosphate dehydratase [Bacillota bacterium]
MRFGEITRATSETDILLSLALDGKGESTIDTGVGFFDHMLTAFAKHGFFDLNVQARGDLEVDAHHTVEDVGIVLGQALAKALGNKAGITRFGTAFVPMDEALVMASLDISGRPYLALDWALPNETLGTFPAV